MHFAQRPSPPPNPRVAVPCARAGRPGRRPLPRLAGAERAAADAAVARAAAGPGASRGDAGAVATALETAPRCADVDAHVIAVRSWPVQNGATPCCPVCTYHNDICQGLSREGRSSMRPCRTLGVRRGLAVPGAGLNFSPQRSPRLPSASLLVLPLPLLLQDHCSRMTQCPRLMYDVSQ